MKKALLSLVVLTSISTNASLVAVMDSGTDTGHVRLASKSWVNVNEQIGNVDFDGDGLPGNKYGWDYTTNTSKFFNGQYASLYTGDVKKFFDLMGKYDVGTISMAEITWLREKFNDQTLMGLVNFMGTYNHGTHVAGISTQGSNLITLMPIKVLSAEPGTEEGDDSAQENKDEDTGSMDPGMTFEKFRDDIINEARLQIESSAHEVSAIGFHKADVANQSYGMGFQQLAQAIRASYIQVFGTDIDRQVLIDLTQEFFSEMERNSMAVSQANSHTLLVIAAGNDSMDNDKYGAFPTNLNIANKISVAASNGYKELADFSNYGATKVDVAAPGVGIISTAVNQEMMPMSGTSQAAPFVTNVAARIKDINPKLNAVEIKKIIMETVDKKTWLKGKVLSEGVVNLNRALKAAEYSTFNTVEVATALARANVSDVPVLKSFGFVAKAKGVKRLNFQPKLKFFSKVLK